ncbi:MAG: hypothetical protein WCC08_16115 [Terrimicrobiaceae bacterium]
MKVLIVLTFMQIGEEEAEDQDRKVRSESQRHEKPTTNGKVIFTGNDAAICASGWAKRTTSAGAG